MAQNWYLERSHVKALCSRSLKYVLRPRPRVKIVKHPPAAAPLISVIIPTYNWSAVLRYAIRSVLWQTEQNFEVLVMGDGCTDDSEAVVRSFGDARIEWRNLPENSGHQTAPNNAGLALARGEYAATFSHDDVWHPDHLRTMLAAFQFSGADIVAAWTEMIGPKGSNFRAINGVFPPSGFDASGTLVPSGMMFRRRVAQKLGGWKDYRTIAQTPDLDFIRRAKAAGCTFASTGELTVFKFNSALRKNSYVERPCHEQAKYTKRIQWDPFFMVRESLAIARIHWFKQPMQFPDFTPPPSEDALGWQVSQYRKYRGLE